MTWPDSFYVTYAYDSANDLTGILENGTTSLAAYAYDNLGRETLLTRGNASTQTPAYDNASNLASLAQDLASSANDNTITLAHNAAARSQSNTAYQWSPIAPGTQSYSANGLNQYSTVASASFTYDARGNLTSDGTHTYSYDIYNRLLTGPNSAALSYDPGGRLYETSGTGAATTRFLYDGANIIAEYDASGNMLRRTVHGLSGPIISFDGAGAKTWLIPDERGSIIANDNGSTVTINSYDEYGQGGSANAGRFQYVGMPWIAEAGVYHMGARDYAPGIGRWMQTDPILTAGGINLYAYVGNDPVNAVDPSGLDVYMVCAQVRGYPEDCAYYGHGVGTYVSSSGGRMPQPPHGGDAGNAGDGNGAPHDYNIAVPTTCTAAEAFNQMKRPGVSAPGAPAAQEGFTPRINLTGNNPISQSVNSSTMTIVNTTLPTHAFYPGTVTIHVIPSGGGTSTIFIRGTGNGAWPLLNDIAGLIIFGGAAGGVADLCAAQKGLPHSHAW